MPWRKVLRHFRSCSTEGRGGALAEVTGPAQADLLALDPPQPPPLLLKLTYLNLLARWYAAHSSARGLQVNGFATLLRLVCWAVLPSDGYTRDGV